MDITTLGTVVGIVAICYVIGLGCKAYEKIPDKWIPVIMAVSVSYTHLTLPTT